MKKTILPILVALPLYMFAQNTEGTILFEEKIDMHARLDDSPEHMEIKKMMPQYSTTQFELLFASNTTLYRELKEEASEEEYTQDIPLHGGQGTFTMKMERPQNTYFRDYTASTKIEQRYFFDKAFLISEDMETPAWKLTGEAMKILGFECQKAVLEVDEENEIEAWFTPQIPVTGGPASYSHLPGMILQVTMDGGNRTIAATEVNFEPLDPSEMKAPDEGKKISEEKYDKMVEERMREMGAQREGGGFKVIRIDRGNNHQHN